MPNISTILMKLLLTDVTIERQQVGTLVRYSPTTGEALPYKFLVPLAQWVVPGKGLFPGLHSDKTNLISHGRQPKGRKP